MVVKQNGYWGLYNANENRWMLPLHFHEIKQYVDENLPLIKVKRHKTDNYRYYDFNGTLILSEKAEIKGSGIGYLFFYKNGNKYRLEYSSIKQKFNWYKS